MRKAAAKTTTELEDVEQSIIAETAKRQFIWATANLGGRLAITVVVPIVAGVKLDEHFHSAPSLTLGGFFIAVAAGCAAVWSTVKEVNAAQASEEANTKRRKPKRVK